MMLPPAVTVHGFDHAHEAVAPGLPVLLLSAPGAAGFAGAGWWRALMDTLPPGRWTDALDCGADPGRALEALHAGSRIIVLLPCPAFAAVVAREPRATVLDARPHSLDLGHRGAARRLLAWLGDAAARGDSARPLG